MDSINIETNTLIKIRELTENNFAEIVKLLQNLDDENKLKKMFSTSYSVSNLNVDILSLTNSTYGIRFDIEVVKSDFNNTKTFNINLVNTRNVIIFKFSIENPMTTNSNILEELMDKYMIMKGDK